MDDDISALLDAMSSDKPTEGGGSDSTDAAQRGADSAATQRDLKTKRQQDKARLPTGTVSSGWHAAEWQRHALARSAPQLGRWAGSPPPKRRHRLERTSEILALRVDHLEHGVRVVGVAHRGHCCLISHGRRRCVLGPMVLDA